MDADLCFKGFSSFLGEYGERVLILYEIGHGYISTAIVFSSVFLSKVHNDPQCHICLHDSAYFTFLLTQKYKLSILFIYGIYGMNGIYAINRMNNFRIKSVYSRP